MTQSSCMLKIRFPLELFGESTGTAKFSSAHFSDKIMMFND